MPLLWPVKRKNITFISRPNPGSYQRDYVVSAVILLRDVLKYAQTLKEVKYILHNEKVLVNGKEIKDTRFPVGLFDVIEIPTTKEKFTLLFDEFGKVKLVNSKDDLVFMKVTGKKNVRGGKHQLNFMNGFNLFVDEKTFSKLNVEDTLVYNFKSKKVDSTIPLKEGSFVYIFDGKFKGRFVELQSITKYNGITRDLVEIKEGKEIHSTAKDYCFAIGTKKEDVKRFN